MSVEAERESPSKLFLWALFLMVVALLLNTFFSGGVAGYVGLGCGIGAVVLAVVYCVRWIRHRR